MSTKKATPKDFTYMKQVPACHVYTFKYLSPREMSEHEQERIQDVMSECGYGEVVKVEVVTNDFDEACGILKLQAHQ